MASSELKLASLSGNTLSLLSSSGQKASGIESCDLNPTNNQYAVHVTYLGDISYVQINYSTQTITFLNSSFNSNIGFFKVRWNPSGTNIVSVGTN